MVVNAEDRLSIPPPPPRWWLRIVLAVAVVCALVAGGLWAYERFLVRCAEGVSRSGPYNECIGVTEGAYAFHDDLADVIGRIHTENQRIEASEADWVSVVYFEPMTLGTGDKGLASIEQELQGAYLAQYALNRHEVGGNGSDPQIKLLLANPGRGSEQWATVVEQITGMAGEEHRVVAVAGFGQSRDTTKAAVTALRAEDVAVPMIGSTVTADSLSARKPPGFYRAVSPNSHQAAAVVQHLAKKQKADRGFTVQLVEDLNADDIYSSSLRKGFEDAAGAAGLEVDGTTLEFVSKGQGVDNLLAEVADKVCEKADQPGAVYFAGRGRDLKGFIEAADALGEECPVTVYTGDDAVGMFFDIAPLEKPDDYQRFLQHWEDSGVMVRYTALAHPDAAGDMYGEPDGTYEDFRDLYTGASGEDFRLGSESDLLNGQAMLGRDAVWVLGEAIRKVATGRGQDELSAGSVGDWLETQMNVDDPVHGVSGPIGFDDWGNPYKRHPLVALSPSKSAGPTGSCDDEKTPAPQQKHDSRCVTVLPEAPHTP